MQSGFARFFKLHIISLLFGFTLIIAGSFWLLSPLSTSAQQEAQIHTVVEGLINPVGMALLPNGGLLIAEEGTGANDLSGGVSLLTPQGALGRLISGLPSSRDSGDLSGVPLVGVAPDGSQIYVGSFNAQHLWTLPIPEDGALSLPPTPYTPSELGTAMNPLNRVWVVNPFDITFDESGRPVVTDATGNGVAKETADGTTQFIQRFSPLPNPENPNRPIEAVPTGIARIGDEYYVTLTGGCPFPSGGGQLVAINEAREQRTVLEGLNMPIDIAQGEDGTLWLLEFARFTPDASCFSGMGYQAHTGRLSRISPDGQLEVVLDDLNFPASVLPLPDGSLYITEIFDGRIVHVTFGDEDYGAHPARVDVPQLSIPEPTYNLIDDPDAALREAIDRYNLQANPGAELREGDTPLAQLGQLLFFDPILSGDQNISCATCHNPAFAMTDGRVLPIGTGGVGLGPQRDFLTHITLAADAQGRLINAEAGETVPNPFIGTFIPRNSPTILNAALLTAQFWDGRVQNYATGGTVITLEEEVNELELTDALTAQALFPITSMHEMAGASLGDLPPMQIRRIIAERVAAIPAYQALFEAAFGTAEVSPQRIVEAIAAFERQFIYTNSAWDDYISGNNSALTEQQKRGALLFYGVLNDAVNCATCHSGDLFTDMNYYNILAPQLGPGKGHGANGREDWGRGRVTFDWRDQYRFRTPPLRNVALTAPYFHAGAYPTLEDAIRHHANIWEAAAQYDPSAYLPPQFFSSVQPFNPSRQAHSVAPQLANGLPLSEEDIADLVAFLESLTDPQATDLLDFIPQSVPSGLPLDPLPDKTPQEVQTGGDSAQTVPESQTETAEDTAVVWRFVDVAEEAGLDFVQQAFRNAIYQDPAAMMGGGLCWLDYDNDGWLDLYLVNSYAEDEVDYWQAQGGLPTNALYRNNGGTFENVSADSGSALSMRGNGCVAADFNNDGWTDIFITADGPNALLWNNGDGTFSEGAEAAGLDAPEWNTAAAVADLNDDGWLDLYVGSYIDLNNKVPRPVGAFPQDYYGLPDHLYINNGAGAEGQVTFSDMADEVGLIHNERALGAIFTDVDNDGDLDLYIANDGQPNRLYINQPTPDKAPGFHFLEVTDSAEVGDTGSGMGVTSGDYDGDGRFDLFITNWQAEFNALYRNETETTDEAHFQYSTYRVGLQGIGRDLTGWGTTFADFDLDSDLDLLIVNGYVPISNFENDAQPIYLYGNRTAEGATGQFRDWRVRTGLRDVENLLARGSAVADYDKDGDLDVAINTIGGHVALLRNGGIQANWLAVGFSQVMPGTRAIVVLSDGRELHRELHIGSSYLASETPYLHFGLGEESIEQLIINLPNGETLIYNEPPINQYMQITLP